MAENTPGARPAPPSGAFLLFKTLEAIPGGVLVLGGDRTVIHSNPASRRFLRTNDRDIIGMELGDLASGRLGELVEILDDPALRVHPVVREIVLDDDGGQSRTVEASVILPDTVSDLFLVFLADITYRKHLEVELRRSNAFFRNLIESSLDGIVAADMEGNVILFNPSAQKLLGYTETEWRAGFHVTKLYPKGEAGEMLRRMRSDDFGGPGKVLRHKILARTREGHRIPVSFSGVIIYDEGKEIATFGIFSDLRAMQKIAEDLEQTQQMLLQASKMAGLGRLAAGVAHEINNPLSGIMLYANFVLEALGNDSPCAQDVGRIIAEAERCEAIVRDLLEFSHQSMTGRMVHVNVNEQIRRTLGTLLHQPLFYHVDVEYQLQKALAPILGNPIKLNQVFMNILVNAAQAMNGMGRITISTRDKSHKDIVEIEITDSGPGIDAEIQSRIFDPFFTTKPGGQGTGLGLSISYAIVKEHRGTIRARSSPGQGTAFLLRFPAAQSPRGQDGAEGM